MLGEYVKSDLEKMVGHDEKILWKRKPEKKCFILEGIFNPLLPFALLWLLFDSCFIGVAFWGTRSQNASAEIGPALIFIVIFFMFHLMPVWIYLIGALFTFKRYKNTQYIVTDRGVYLSGGIFSYTCEMKPYMELSRVNIHRGIFDQWLGVGDVVLSAHESFNRYPNVRGMPLHSGLTIADIPDYQAVFEMIKKLQTDIYADTMYPNDLRPKENRGYNTEYKGM